MPDVTLIMLAVGALAVAIPVTAVLARSPRATLVVWAVVMFFVPIWLGATVGFFVSAAVFMTLLAVALHASRYRFSFVDLFVVVFAVLIVVLFALRQVELTYLVSGLLELAVPYFWGRIAYDRLGVRTIAATIAACAMAAAALAVFEFVSQTNLFLLIPGNDGLRAVWATIQIRGGVARVEGAFGHSIALGAVLAMSSAFVLASGFRAWVRIAGTVVIGVAVVMTLSRIGIITFVLTVIISLLLQRSVDAVTRWGLVAILMVAGIVAVPFLSTIFGDAGSEASGSAGYRGDLTILLSQVQLLGGAPNWEDLVVGDTYLGHFSNSTDNALISLLLRYGYMPVIALFAAYAGTVLLAFRHRRIGPAAVAIIAQVPSLVAVAFITQYGMLLWFFVGVATSQALAAHRAAPAMTRRALAGRA